MARANPPKGTKNPITLILEEAIELVMEAEKELLEEFGLPLFTEAPGTGLSMMRWPDDPTKMSPEDAQQLVALHGKDNVTQWLMEEAMRRMAESTMSPDGADGQPIGL